MSLSKFPWKTVLLTLLVWTLFWEIKEAIAGERTFILYRWIYSDKGFAKNIEILTYLLTDEQVVYMLSHPNEEVRQPTRQELRLKNAYVVLRLRNVKGGVASGRLRWSMFGGPGHLVDVVDIPSPNEKFNKYSDVILPVGVVVASRKDGLPDPIKVEWDRLSVCQ